MVVRATRCVGGTPGVKPSPDGTRLLSGGNDSALKLWDAASGQLIRTFEGREGYALSEGHVINAVAFSPDGKRVLSANFHGTLKLWDVASGRVIRKFRGNLRIRYAIDQGRFWLVALSEEKFDVAVQ